MDDKDKVTMWWDDWRGNRQTLEVNQVIDVRDFIGTPGYAMLLVAANTNLSVPKIDQFLAIQARETPGVARSLSWIQKRRWLFQQPGTSNRTGPQPNTDGKLDRALSIMAQHPTLSLRDLTLLLGEHGIDRSREWVRMNRCKGCA